MANLCVPYSGMPMRTGTGGVLIVDPQELVRTTLSKLFQLKGVASYVAGTAAEARQLYKRHRHEIGVILLDPHMTDADGQQTLRQLRDIDPTARCYFMTGDPELCTDKAVAEAGSLGVVVKPFLFRMLDHIIQLCRSKA